MKVLSCSLCKHQGVRDNVGQEPSRSDSKKKEDQLIKYGGLKENNEEFAEFLD